MSASMNARLKELAERIDERSLRERALLFIGLMVLIYVVASGWVFSPLQQEQARLARALKEQHAEIDVFNTKIQTFLTQGGQNEQTQRARLKSLQDELRSLDTAVGQINKRLVPPKEMAKLVAQVLRSNEGLQLLKIESLPSTIVEDKNVQQQLGSNTIYRHGMRVQFRGEYRDIVSYLHALETLPWRIYWGEVSLVTDLYPRSTVTVVIYTLSLNEAWIGV